MKQPIKPLLLVAIAAVLMGLPTVRGGFVGGDDHRLALDHVLVNRPSLEHAVQLFAITHRDLYQPLPLLTFSVEFLICDWLGLTRGGPERFAWFFHLNNVWLHALNALLVFFTVRMLQSNLSGGHSSTKRRPEGDATPEQLHTASWPDANVVAAIAAMIFAVHPLNAEVVAWTNGRMMLLSTLFGLLSLLTWHAWLDADPTGNTKPNGARSRSRRLGLALMTVLFVLCCAISKIRIGLPVLMLIVAWTARRRILSRRFLPLWLACTAITAVFAVINIQATAAAELFAGGAEHLRGPRIIRVLSALAFYFTRLVCPIRLASYYPAPPVVSWSDRETWLAILVVLPTLALLAWASWRSRVWRYGVLWFFATIFAVLPFMPARNIMAADRYMYLPMIGLLWPLAITLLALWDRVRDQISHPSHRHVAVAPAVLAVIAMIAQSWHIEWYYETPLKKTRRIAMLFPDVPRVWERLGWSYYELGEYTRAAELAKKELHHNVPDVQSGAYQLMGMCAFKQGKADEALTWLHKAIEVDPDNALGKYRLATVYDDLGRYDEAVIWYEQAVEAAPKSNPTIHRLANLYRRLGRRDDARRLYQRELENNPFEVSALVALAELSLEDGDAQEWETMRDRLAELLHHIPDATAARITLGLIEVKRGRPERAVEAYTRVLADDPDNTTALLNLAQLYMSMGKADQAAPLFERAARLPLTVEQTAAVSDYLVQRRQWARAERLWAKHLTHTADDEPTVRLHLAWVCALRGETDRARTVMESINAATNRRPLAVALSAFLALTQGAYKDAVEQVRLLQGDETSLFEARRRLLSALEHFDARSPGNPWTFCTAARLLIDNGQFDAANVSIDLCRRFCNDEACRNEIAALARTLDEPDIETDREKKDATQ